jgi:hypothetical protein
VPLSAVPDLTIVVPVGVQGKSDVVIDLVKDDGIVLAAVRTELVVAPAATAHALHQPGLVTAGIKADLVPPPQDPSPLAAIRKEFDAFVAKSGMATDEGTAATKTALSANQKAEMFRLFLTWPQNSLEVEVTMRLTSESGVGSVIGTIAVKNSEVLVAGRKEPALFLKPNLGGLRPGLYAFHVHENPNCGPALKDGKPFPGLAAGAHLWLSVRSSLATSVRAARISLSKARRSGLGDGARRVLRLDLVVDERVEQELFAHVLEEVLLSPALEHAVGDLDVAQVPATGDHVRLMAAVAQPRDLPQAQLALKAGRAEDTQQSAHRDWRDGG